MLCWLYLICVSVSVFISRLLFVYVCFSFFLFFVSFFLQLWNCNVYVINNKFNLILILILIFQVTEIKHQTSALMQVVEILVLLIAVSSWLWVDTSFSQSAFCFDLLECNGIIGQYTSINCHDELSCNNSIISPISGGSSLNIHCEGSHSSINAIFNNVTYISSDGPFAMRNSVIDNYNTSLTFRSRSYHSVYNVTIHCLNRSDCIFECDGISCNHISMICDSTSNCTQTGQAYTLNLPNLTFYYRDYYVWESISQSMNI